MNKPSKIFNRKYYENSKQLSSMKPPADMHIILEYLDPKPGDKILDCGCGLGRIALAIAKYGSTVKGVDVSEYAIEQASKLHTEKNMEFECVNGVELPYKDEFDKITCYHVLEHLNQKDGETLIKNLYYALKKDGIIVIGVPLEENNIIRTCIRLLATRRFKRDPTHIRFFSLLSIKTELKNAGLEILNCSPYSYYNIKTTEIPYIGKKLLTCVVIKARKDIG